MSTPFQCEDVEVECSGTPTHLAVATMVVLDPLKDVEQLEGGQSGLHDHHRVEIRALFGTTHRSGLIEG
jgi:hypothetical protein